MVNYHSYDTTWDWFTSLSSSGHKNICLGDSQRATDFDFQFWLPRVQFNGGFNLLSIVTLNKLRTKVVFKKWQDDHVFVRRSIIKDLQGAHGGSLFKATTMLCHCEHFFLFMEALFDHVNYDMLKTASNNSITDGFQQACSPQEA